MNKVEKFLSDDLASFLLDVALSSNDSFLDDGGVIGSTVGYDNESMNRLMLMIKPKVESLYGKRLHPTYTMYRIYKEGMELAPHKDRPACEVSVTITLGYRCEYLWPMYVDGVPYATDIGQGVIYKGCDQLHWRDPLKRVSEDFEDTTWVQLFVHYIEAGGVYDPEHIMDKFQKENNSQGEYK